VVLCGLGLVCGGLEDRKEVTCVVTPLHLKTGEVLLELWTYRHMCLLYGFLMLLTPYEAMVRLLGCLGVEEVDSR